MSTALPATTRTYRLANVEDGYAEVIVKSTRTRSGELLGGYVCREKAGSGRTSVRWYATTGGGRKLGSAWTRAEAIALVIAR